MSKFPAYLRLLPSPDCEGGVHPLIEASPVHARYGLENGWAAQVDEEGTWKLFTPEGELSTEYTVLLDPTKIRLVLIDTVGDVHCVGSWELIYETTD